MAIKDIENEPGYVYDDEKPSKIEDGKKMFSSHFDRNRAKELEMSEEEIRLHETGVKNREHFIYSN